MAVMTAATVTKRTLKASSMRRDRTRQPSLEQYSMAGCMLRIPSKQGMHQEK